MKFIGYHGTDANSANSIDSEGFSDSPESAWSGAGVYFFEEQEGVFNGFEDAKWWVNSVKKYRYWVIFKAQIISSKVLDLVSNKQDQNMYQQIYKKKKKKHLEAGKKRADFSCHDVILQARRKVEVIRCVVDASKMAAEINSYIVGQPQIQLCVCRNNGIVIKSYSRKEEN